MHPLPTRTPRLSRAPAKRKTGKAVALITICTATQDTGRPAAASWSRITHSSEVMCSVSYGLESSCAATRHAYLLWCHIMCHAHGVRNLFVSRAGVVRVGLRA